MPRLFHHWVPVRLLLLLGGELVIAFACLHAGLLLPVFGFLPILPAWGSAIPAALTLGVLVLVTVDVAGLHDLSHRYGHREHLLRLTLALGAAYLGLAVLGYVFTPEWLGRKAYVLSFLLGLPLTFGFRIAYQRLTSGSRRRRRVLLLGASRLGRLVAGAIASSNDGYETIGCLTAGGPDGDPPPAKVLGSVDDLHWIVRIARPDVIVVAMEERRQHLALSAIVDCKFRGIDVEDWPDFYEKLTGKIPVTDLRPSWLVFSDGFKKTRATLAAKRAIDVLVAVLALALTFPLLVLIATAIKLESPGPVLFRQVRLGHHGRVFSLLKFRSMRVPDRPAMPTEDQQLRITTVGRLLRRSRLDELPQLVNVLRGEMSLVGPRPEWLALVPEFDDKVPFYLHRLAVKPGITGWAQVRNAYGSSVENTLEKLQYDLYYIKNMSIFLDLLVLLHTLQIVLFTRGSVAWTNSNQPASTLRASSVG